MKYDRSEPDAAQNQHEDVRDLILDGIEHPLEGDYRISERLMRKHQKRIRHKAGASVRRSQKADHQSDDQTGQVSGDVGDGSVESGSDGGRRGWILVVADAQLPFDSVPFDSQRRISAFEKRTSPVELGDAAESRVAVDGQYPVARRQFSRSRACGIDGLDHDASRPGDGRVPVLIELLIFEDHPGDKDAEANERQPGDDGKPEEPGSAFGWLDQFFVRQFHNFIRL